MRSPFFAISRDFAISCNFPQFSRIFLFEETQKHSEPPVQKRCSLRLQDIWLRHRNFFSAISPNFSPFFFCNFPRNFSQLDLTLPDRPPPPPRRHSVHQNRPLILQTVSIWCRLELKWHMVRFTWGFGPCFGFALSGAVGRNHEFAFGTTFPTDC